MTETDDALIDRLIRHEGLRLKPYRDTARKLTIGVGRNLDDVGISRAEALMLLRSDIAAAHAGLDQRWPWWRTLDPVRGDAVVELMFNMGAGGLAEFRDFLGALESKAYASAASNLLASQWAKEVGSRAQDLASLIRTGQAA